MSKEAMKLALEALETERENYQDWDKQDGAPEYIYEAITALREELAKPDFWEGYVPEPVKPATEESSATQAQQALDKKAENARELGLDYEPVCNKDPQGCWNVRCQLGKKCKNTPAQQEPVAWIDMSQWPPIRWRDGMLRKDVDQFDGQGLYTSPPAQRTWVGLTDEERKLVRNSVGYNQFVTAGEYAEHVQKATEFKLLEKNK